MARLRASEASTNRAPSSANSLYRDPSVSLAPHPESPSSDKENQDTRSRSKSSAMDASHSSKRRRLADRDGSTHYESSSAADEDGSDAPRGTEAAPPRSGNDGEDSDDYDPYQDISTRRQLRKEFRNMDKTMQEQRSEWMKPDSRELEHAIKHQNSVYKDVKQTSEATLDSRMLVSAGEIAYKRTKNLNIGNNAQGIDVEEFIGKCISFMRSGTEAGASATQRRRRAAEREEDDEADLNQGDALDWAFFGTQACMPFNKRPATTSFLLGPLSVQKAPRAPRQRRERLQRTDPVDAVQAKELRADELGRAENSNVTVACKKILTSFVAAVEEGHEYAREFWDTQDDDTEIPPDEWAEFKKRSPIMEDGGLSLFKFVINPTDFGQTVENLFYLSFLIKDDFVELRFDSDGLPSLHPVEDTVRQDTTRVKGERYQQIFTLDWPTWQALIEVNDIKRPMITDRAGDASGTQINSSGWYG